MTRRATEIGGRRCVPTIADLPAGIDAAVLIVPEAAVAEAINGCIERGIGGIALFAAGFAETGEEGRAKQEKIAALAREAGIALEGPNCMGFANFVDRVSVSFGAVETGIIAAGAHGAAVIAQSGAMREHRLGARCQRRRRQLYDLDRQRGGHQRRGFPRRCARR